MFYWFADYLGGFYRFHINFMSRLEYGHQFYKSHSSGFLYGIFTL